MYIGVKTMARVYNFCAGPAALPEEVLAQAREEILDWHGKGLSVMEMSHRGKDFVSIAEEAEQDLRDLLSISDDYAVLFLQGGASTQFSAIPLNLLNGGSADYVITGQWSKKAAKEAQRFGMINIAADSAGTNYTTIPTFDTWKLSKGASYLHYTPNETIGGVEYLWTPKVNVPLVADMSSTILSRPVNVNDFGVIYAGAQKNIGPAGLTIVIVRKDLLGKASTNTPTMLDWKVAADAGSMYNTPPTYSVYLAGLVFKWLKNQGGLEAMEKRNRAKAEKLYNYIDNSGYYANPVEVASRSWMNIPFTIADSSLEKAFVQQAEEQGLLYLSGHRSVGGMRASIYNAVPEAAVDALIDFMKAFAKENA